MAPVGRADSDEFSGELVFSNRTLASAPENASVPAEEDIMRLPSLGEGYKSSLLEPSTAASGGSRASFMRWHSQGHLLMEMKRDDERMRREAKALFESSSCGDSMCEGEFGSTKPSESPDSDRHDSLARLSTVFFTSDSQLQPVNNGVVSFLLKTFRQLDESKLISAPFELTSEIEAFRSRIFEVMNKEFNSLSLSEALLTVAFNHYAGVSHPGYMTLDEYMSMMSLYKGVFANETMTRFVFDSMDRRRQLMITLNDFIAGMMACSPQAAHKVTSATGRLRLQHIFRAYDVKRKGYLDHDALRVLLTHIQQLARIANSSKVERMPSMNGSFIDIRRSDSLSESDPQSATSNLNEVLDLIMSTYENGFGYDAFYSSVESGLIKDSHLLLRSDKDFAELVGQHLIHALGRVVIPSEVAAKAEVTPLPVETPPPQEEEPKPAPVNEDVSGRSVDRTRKPSIWSSANSPRSAEATSLAPSPYASTYARDGRVHSLEPFYGLSGVRESPRSLSSRSHYGLSGLGTDRKPLFQPAPLKGGSLDATIRPFNEDAFFRKLAPYTKAGNFRSYDADNEPRQLGGKASALGLGLGMGIPQGASAFQGSAAVSEPELPAGNLLSTKALENALSATRGQGVARDVVPFLPKGENAWNRAKSVECHTEWMTFRKRADTDGILGTSRSAGYARISGLGMAGFGFSDLCDPVKDKMGISESMLTSNLNMSTTPPQDTTTETLALNDASPSMIGATLRRSNSRSQETTECKMDAPAPERHNSVRFEDSVPASSATAASDSDLEGILSRRLSDLCRRYRARFIGFNSCMLADSTIALKVYGEIYTRTFKCQDYWGVFERFHWCSYNELLELCDVVCGVVRQEGSVLHMEGTVQMHGPLNGSVLTLLESFNCLGWPLHGNTADRSVARAVDASQYAKGETTKLVFLGDLIGEVEGFSLETLLVLFSLKVLYPYHVFLLRGRREARRRDYKSALFREIYAKLSGNARQLKLADDEALLLQSAQELYHRIYDVFEHLSLAAIVDERVLCVHGALSKAFRSVEQLARVRKPVIVEQTSVKGDNRSRGAYANVHVRNACFGTLSDTVADASGEQFHADFTERELAYCMRRGGVEMLITAGPPTERGYSYAYGDRVLQLGGYTPGGIYSAALLREQRNTQYVITHRSIKLP
ncbi:hypothetical protein, conserved [Babesia bigemina]|uniref:EF-hand domain-containing protein n=1 Tax=Babesia bigemina TaxID=5866 RepID=A0A061D8E2_BABBI|nr:hypothetical protein, conserved [Babesia bigemina]CDR96966.1 hypothetical protein, conserved [Babesia bigemina]|eukprot:XP_012769152.1 hypothetical protein, conserved [Babesia bigemina]